MEDNNKTFKIKISLPGSVGDTILTISHPDETFGTTLNDKAISLINNGDNSWSQVNGDTNQQTINTIGEAIEQYYQKQSL